ncbi:hypothetical protein N8I71_02420 [Roseibacterium sp. SDUM158016]|uniref:hypothetical protein n=1 Tax=Roseicyclus sediminis TaxID=2980997 RepID=UPI0021CE56F1|nr:hypothetical protein [Roseibacterium sp. SDUM158016]MCU4651665.1 hypothetical protein [Roseibacterium sp. SDUM158016]
MKPLWPLALLLFVAVSGPSRAIELDGVELTLAYGDASSTTGTEGDGVQALGAATFSITPQFDLRFGLSYAEASANIGRSVDVMGLTADARFHFTDQAYAGLFTANYFIDLQVLPIEPVFRYSGLFLGYEAGGFSVEAFFGHSDYDNLVPDGEVMGLSLGYNFGNGFDVHGFANTEDLGGRQLDQRGLGVGYYLDTGGSAPPVYAHLTASRGDIGTNRIEALNLGVTIPLGNGAPIHGRREFAPRAPYVNLASQLAEF